ncbi:S-adenosyl-L-methionine dependent methyltransferase [Dichomitus squalens]|uniref:S-adenosyl-L-methionine dependent methyltransferase n=1 Tax=Dichomitus squalens TaxID=114155 RepID=A0A4Q9PGH1_9APHY|nr:S-adenosyl-L-methionine dependent methyltransferase [Dichomitus squalens]TBU52332.1 S-adenosyl-L-methionine dependent methyltransferase [Dichomitus squalens]
MEPSASVYTTFNLRVYDLVVLVFSNIFAWRCSTRSILLPLYEQHLKESTAHLEIGAGTGYYPAAAASSGALSKTRLVTLCDLNPTTLEYSRQRLEKAGYRGSIQTLVHNVFQPLPEDMHGKYDSVVLYYLFHCLPGSFPRKAIDVLANVVPALSPDGVVYGSTVLGQGVAHNWLGRRLMGLYNRKGIFGNVGDSVDGLRQALEEAFEESSVEVVGVVALFEGRKPRAIKT